MSPTNAVVSCCKYLSVHPSVLIINLRKKLMVLINQTPKPQDTREKHIKWKNIDNICGGRAKKVLKKGS